VPTGESPADLEPKLVTETVEPPAIDCEMRAGVVGAGVGNCRSNHSGMLDSGGDIGVDLRPAG
jgi:hypothetical protein